MRTVSIVVALVILLVLAGCSQVEPEMVTPAVPVDTLVVEPTATDAPPTQTAIPTATSTPAPTLTPTPAYETLGIAIPEGFAIGGEPVAPRVMALDLTAEGYVLEEAAEDDATLRLRVMAGAEAQAGARYLFGWRYYVPVVPFDTVDDIFGPDMPLDRWLGTGSGALVMDADTASVLSALWGDGQPRIVASEGLLAELQADRTAVGIVPFEALEPNFKVLGFGGLSLFDAALHPVGQWPAEVGPLLAEQMAGWENRDASKLTRLVMTGVTAMCRLTAARMESYGTEYPALVIGEELSKADITHVSNEVPFVSGCPVDTSSNNLTFCSDYDYWDALAAIGTDVVGLSGNHVNDFGYAGARESITFYRERGIPIYGSGLNETEACAPMFFEHNGNRLAFIAALAYDPSYAWATDDLPGACYFYNNKERLLASVAELAADPEVDMVLVELQYEETYVPYPTGNQVIEFRELRAAGADIVTGVQSHVPQAWEPYGADDANGSGIIVYGLGNLFFDQMWSWETRTGLIARHTIYDGRLVNSEVLTTVLEDYAQPRWAGADERAEILTRIFGGAPER
jgi:poly-gamma-glutamate synthesis protein (capsule biosynthesis protein)